MCGFSLIDIDPVIPVNVLPFAVHIRNGGGGSRQEGGVAINYFYRLSKQISAYRFKARCT